MDMQQHVSLRWEKNKIEIWPKCENTISLLNILQMTFILNHSTLYDYTGVYKGTQKKLS